MNGDDKGGIKEGVFDEKRVEACERQKEEIRCAMNEENRARKINK